jgi:hypothetical protein
MPWALLSTAQVESLAREGVHPPGRDEPVHEAVRDLLDQTPLILAQERIAQLEAQLRAQAEAEASARAAKAERERQRRAGAAAASPATPSSEG